MNRALQYYYDFTLYVNSKASLAKIRLPLLDELIENGDSPISVYENKVDEKPELENKQTLINEKYAWYKSYLNKGLN